MSCVAGCTPVPTESPLPAGQRHAAVIGAHVQPTPPVGEVAATPGTVNAAEFAIVVNGYGGHAAYPHLTSDPVLALAHVIVALQRVVSRDVDPTSPAVLGVSTLAASGASNLGHARPDRVPHAAVVRSRRLLPPVGGAAGPDGSPA